MWVALVATFLLVAGCDVATDESGAAGSAQEAAEATTDAVDGADGTPEPVAAVTELADEVDVFAADVLDRAQQVSFDEEREFCGYIIETPEGQLRASEPRPGTTDSCDLSDSPDDVVIVASYHTHGGADPEYDSEVPSVDDLSGDIADGIDGYVATPGGRLWRNDAETGRALLLCAKACLTADPDFAECPTDLTVSSFTLDELQARVDEGLVDCGLG